MQDNMKHNNIHIIGITEGEEEEQGIEDLFEKVMMENFPNLMREKVTQIQETQRKDIVEVNDELDQVALYIHRNFHPKTAKNTHSFQMHMEHFQRPRGRTQNTPQQIQEN